MLAPEISVDVDVSMGKRNDGAAIALTKSLAVHLAKQGFNR